jgi:hypothetical protein
LVLGRRLGTGPVIRFGSVAHAFAAEAACVVAIVPGER